FSHLSELIAVHVNSGILHDERVGKVEPLHPEFHLLHFTDLECPADREIKLPEAGAFHAAHAGIPESSQCRLCESCRIEEISRCSVTVGISQNLAGSLAGAGCETTSDGWEKVTRQRSVQTRNDAH